ncbi:pyridoxal-dependent decarboxylase [Sphingorhabdus sp. EL138]|uniref:pyridoxal phosphate-dependent decarboxylase family protein n=1 Tax=Sphingorhabdus sp. EL138 TaxID=2073156 RepID=UPI000D693F3E|nr:pyridoxal-dependent decarboxylase [Sphingorhabdus sp. EL138]
MSNNDRYTFPEIGLSLSEVEAELDLLNDQMTDGEQGKLASTAFWGDADMKDTVSAAYDRFHGWNALFTFQEAAAARMENEVMDICVGLAGGGSDACGNLTSGGTESIFCALQAMRAWAREHRPHIKNPEIVAPYSIHATLHKSAQLLDLKVVTVAQRDNLSADLEGMIAAIGENTIGIACSAPNWPYAQIDPVEELGAVAVEHDLWLHVDACVGAYILPFFRELGEEIPPYDLSVPGVRSMSGDLHKYGYAPKPLSSVLWSSKEEQKYHFLPITDWPCGLYISQSFVGSRPLAPIAACWALFQRFGREGYLENARKVLETRNRIIDAVAGIDGLKTWPTHGPLLQIAGDGLDVQLIVGGMEKFGWRLLGVNDPPAIHLTVDIMRPESLDKFVSDLSTVAKQVLSGEQDEEGLLSYGGVGASETAPKWLLNAVEAFDGAH